MSKNPWNIPKPVPRVSQDRRVREEVLQYVRKVKAMSREQLEREFFECLGRSGAHSIKAEEFELAARDATAQNNRTRSDRQRGAQKKLANDPKQKAKNGVKMMFDAWVAGTEKHASDAAFARAAVAKHSCLKDEKNITSWVREWRKNKG